MKIESWMLFKTRCGLLIGYFVGVEDYVET